MKYIKPKTIKKKVSWNISEKTLTILAQYAKYTQYKEEEVVDMFLENLLTDKDFIEWIKKQRNRKKIEAILNDCELITMIEGKKEDEKAEEIDK